VVAPAPTVATRSLATLAALALLATALLLGGCAGSSTGASTTDEAAAPAAGSPTAAAQPSGTPTATPRTERAEPTLPPGDPGLDAPGVDDPNAEPPEPEPTAARGPRRHVPPAALLDGATVGSVTGTTWTPTDPPADGCAAPRPAAATASRIGALAGPEGGLLVETVATYADPGAARAAVRALRARLAGCPGASPSDPRVGDASVQAMVTSPEGTATVVTAIAAEGVLAVLAGTGAVAEEATWPSLTDLALGSTCIAAADGCH
jgi:hypothetical protein